MRAWTTVALAILGMQPDGACMYARAMGSLRFIWSLSRERDPNTGTLAVVHSAGDEAPGPREEQEGVCADGKGSCSSQVCKCRIGISCLDMHLCALWMPAPLKSSECVKFCTLP